MVQCSCLFVSKSIFVLSLVYLHKPPHTTSCCYCLSVPMQTPMCAHHIPHLAAIACLYPCRPQCVLTTYHILLLLLVCTHADPNVCSANQHIPYLVAIACLYPCRPQCALCKSAHTISCCYCLSLPMQTPMCALQITTYHILLLLLVCTHADPNVCSANHHIPHLVAIACLYPCRPQCVLCKSAHTISCCYCLSVPMQTPMCAQQITTYHILLLLLVCTHADPNVRSANHHIPYLAAIACLYPCRPQCALCKSPHTISCCYCLSVPMQTPMCALQITTYHILLLLLVCTHADPNVCSSNHHIHILLLLLVCTHADPNVCSANHHIPHLASIACLYPCRPQCVLCKSPHTISCCYCLSVPMQTPMCALQISTYHILLLLLVCTHADPNVRSANHHIPYLAAIACLYPCRPQCTLCKSPHTISCCYCLSVPMQTPMCALQITTYHILLLLLVCTHADPNVCSANHHTPYLVAIACLYPCRPQCVLCKSPHTISCCYCLSVPMQTPMYALQITTYHILLLLLVCTHADPNVRSANHHIPYLAAIACLYPCRPQCALCKSPHTISCCYCLSVPMQTPMCALQITTHHILLLLLVCTHADPNVCSANHHTPYLAAIACLYPCRPQCVLCKSPHTISCCYCLSVPMQTPMCALQITTHHILLLLLVCTHADPNVCSANHHTPYLAAIACLYPCRPQCVLCKSPHTISCCYCLSVPMQTPMCALQITTYHILLLLLVCTHADPNVRSANHHTPYLAAIACLYPCRPQCVLCKSPHTISCCYCLSVPMQTPMCALQITTYHILLLLLVCTHADPNVCSANQHIPYLAAIACLYPCRPQCALSKSPHTISCCYCLSVPMQTPMCTLQITTYHILLLLLVCTHADPNVRSANHHIPYLAAIACLYPCRPQCVLCKSPHTISCCYCLSVPMQTPMCALQITTYTSCCYCLSVPMQTPMCALQITTYHILLLLLVCTHADPNVCSANHHIPYLAAIACLYPCRPQCVLCKSPHTTSCFYCLSVPMQTPMCALQITTYHILLLLLVCTHADPNVCSANQHIPYLVAIACLYPCRPQCALCKSHIPYLVAIACLYPCRPQCVLCKSPHTISCCYCLSVPMQTPMCAQQITTYHILLLLLVCTHADPNVCSANHHIPYLAAIACLYPCRPQCVLCKSPHTLSCCYCLSVPMQTPMCALQITTYHILLLLLVCTHADPNVCSANHHIPYLVAIACLYPCRPQCVLCKSPHTISCCYCLSVPMQTPMCALQITTYHILLLLLVCTHADPNVCSANHHIPYLAAIACLYPCRPQCALCKSAHTISCCYCLSVPMQTPMCALQITTYHILLLLLVCTHADPNVCSANHHIPYLAAIACLYPCRPQFALCKSAHTISCCYCLSVPMQTPMCALQITTYHILLLLLVCTHADPNVCSANHHIPYLAAIACLYPCRPQCVLCKSPHTISCYYCLSVPMQTPMCALQITTYHILLLLLVCTHADLNVCSANHHIPYLAAIACLYPCRPQCVLCKSPHTISCCYCLSVPMQTPMCALQITTYHILLLLLVCTHADPNVRSANHHIPYLAAIACLYPCRPQCALCKSPHTTSCCYCLSVPIQTPMCALQITTYHILLLLLTILYMTVPIVGSATTSFTDLVFCNCTGELHKPNSACFYR